jgi:FkbM family methyltransferase
MTQYFPYPSLSDELIQQEQKLRRSISGTPEVDRLAIYEVFTSIAEGCEKVKFVVNEHHVIALQVDNEVVFPRPLPINVHACITCGYVKWLKHKYSLPGFVEVEVGDTVIDCGAYVGGFTLSAALKAETVHVFEPEMSNADCIEVNIKNFQNVRLYRSGLHRESTQMHLNVSTSGVEHSFLTPDVGGIVDRRVVDVLRIDDHCMDQGIGAVDFLKCEAEGVEIEVLEGIGDLPIRKIAVDISPEREGLSPGDDIEHMLVKRGYEVRRRANVLFARQVGS